MLPPLGFLMFFLGAASASDVVLAAFDADKGPIRTWKEMNDPVMGGKSEGSFTVKNGLGVFDGEVNDVPFLHAPGFIKADTVDEAAFPDVSSCTGLKLMVRSSVDYKGYRVSIGRARAPHGKRFAYGFKAHFEAPVGQDFAEVLLPFNSFTDYWDDATGEPIKTCQDDPSYCPDMMTLKNMGTMSIWAEGARGKVHLEISAINATGCSSATVVM